MSDPKVYRMSDPEWVEVMPTLIETKAHLMALGDLLQNAEGFRFRHLPQQMQSLRAVAEMLLLEATAKAVTRVRPA